VLDDSCARDLLCNLQLVAVLEVGGNACCAKRMIPNFSLDSRGLCASSDHAAGAAT
jgi:hypothetical protein